MVEGGLVKMQINRMNFRSKPYYDSNHYTKPSVTPASVGSGQRVSAGGRR